MKKLLGLAVLAIALVLGRGSAYAGSACLGTGENCHTTTQVNVTLTGGDICIGSTGSFNFGTHTVSSSPQTVTGTFKPRDYFYVDDQKGADRGYYTTVQISGDLVGTGGAFITGSNLYMKTDPNTILLGGHLNARVYIHAGMGAFQSLDTPRELINRDTENNQGVVGKYGTMPDMQLIIPAYQGVGTYIGTIVFTLYEN